MSTAVIPKRRETTGARAIPIIVYFEEDAIAGRHLAGVQRFRRTSFENAEPESPGVERIVLVSLEEVVEKHYDKLRVPNTRVLALTNRRFKDPRNDGAVFAYLPPDVPQPLLERMVDNALDHIQLVHSRQEVNERLAGVTEEIHALNQIGVALSAEHNTEKLLDLILTKSREFTKSDAGSIYLVEKTPERKTQRALSEPGAPIQTQEEDFQERIRFKLAQNDTVHVPFREITMEINQRSIAGYVALTGAIVNIEDAYHLPPDVPYTINRKFDEDSGYRTKSILAVPMRNQKEKIVGVLQLINAKYDFNTKLDSLSAVMQQVVTYTARQQEIVLSLASQAAVALENNQLYDSIQRLFEGFVRASVSAIEARDPTTSGHSFRVANLTVALAETVDRADSGPYGNIRFTRDQMREIRYASLLHDFGKVGVKEEVLVKAKKLYPAQLEVIRQRFGYVKRTLENESLRARLKFLLEQGKEKFLSNERDFEGKLTGILGEMDAYMQAIAQDNEPTVLPEGSFERLIEIGNVQYIDLEGHTKPLLEPDELRLLSIRKGSLDDEERLQIEAHVMHTYNFLQQIPWTTEIRNIPEIAIGHHEKLNGKGYPHRLSAPEIPLQTRMMTISDIFDALAAADRPYKRAVSVERALEILAFSVKDGELDPNLFEVFKEAKVFERWKVDPYPY
jgi:HD-GYP domain-containing protein (c-di-GMP phosphodiesterase class II)